MTIPILRKPFQFQSFGYNNIHKGLLLAGPIPTDPMEQYELTVEGMSCSGCETIVTTAIERVSGVHRVEVDHETGEVTIAADAETRAEVEQAIYDAGYDVAA